MHHFVTLADVEEVLGRFLPSKVSRVAYTLDHVTAFMDYVGNPQNDVPAIHIAGTSGKTSTAYYAAAALGATGKKVGLLTSPHIDSITERVQVNLQPLTARVFCQEFAIFMDAVEASRISLTYAELLYAFAYWEFSRLRLDYIVVETGLGGLLDATNVITREDKVCVITDIGLDHTNVLGNTLAEIAGQKAGIVGLHNTLLLHTQAAEVVKVVRATARQRQADLHIITPADQPAFAVLPAFQRRNVGLALAAVDYIIQRDSLRPLTDKAIRDVVRTRIPARMEIMQDGNRVIVLDGAHNVQKLQALRQSIADHFPDRPIAALVAFIKSGGRDLTAQLRELEPLYAHLIVTSPGVADGHDWYTAAEVASAAHAAGITSYETIPDHDQAVRALLRRPEPVLVVTGSLYIHQHVRPYLPAH